MANLINDLIGVLEAQTGCYSELLNMADNKTDVIIDGNLPSLQKITSDEQVVAGQILRLDKKRDEIISDISLVTTIPVSELNLSQLINIVKGKPEEERLVKVKDELTDLIAKLKTKNEMNGVLIQESLDLFDFTMNALMSAKDATPVNNYDANEKTGKSIFDSKQ